MDLLLSKRPFLRGGNSPAASDPMSGMDVSSTGKVRVRVPMRRGYVVSQEKFLKELDPRLHDIMFDENIPSICVKLRNGGYTEIKYKKVGVPYQKRILEKKTLHLGGNKTVITMMGARPSETETANYELIKDYWESRNMDGWRNKAIYSQLGTGDAGLLFYHNSENEIRCRLLSYEDGYVIISHSDDNGERILECVYYQDEYGRECVDCWDKRYVYQLRSGDNGWERTMWEHGFSEIPLVTKRGDVAWNDVQELIDTYETIYNIFTVIQKRHGWGILYIKGRFKEQAKKLAGSIILNDTSIDGKGSAEFKTPPSPQGTIEYLQTLDELIQKGASTTFLLPKDVRSSGDISALAIMLTQSLDIEGAEQGVIEWQNFISKMLRLFVEGLAKELVLKGEHKNAVTEFAKLRLSAKMKVWRPFNESEYNQMLCTLKGAGIISTRTAIEKNTVSCPDEISRVEGEVKGQRSKVKGDLPQPSLEGREGSEE